MINPNKIIEKNTEPFPYLIIKDFFEEDFYKKLEKDFPTKKEFLKQGENVGRMHYDSTYGHNLYKNILDNSEAYKKLHNYIYSDQFIKKQK